MRAGAGRREGRIRAAASAALAAVALLIGAGPSPAAVAPEIVSGMQGITAGPDGALWFVATGIGRLTTDGEVTLFPVPAGDAQLFDLAVGADGNVWFTEFGGRVGRITPAGEVAMFPRGIPAPGPCDCLGGRIARGPDGNMWFTVPNGGWIGHVAPDGDYTIVAVTPGRGAPEDIAAGPDGAMWFTDTAGNIGRITLGGDITLFGAGRLAPSEIAAGPDGNMWFTEPGRRRLGRITPAGVVTEFPTGRAGPLDITAGPDGNLWFSSLGGAWIGRMAPTGTLRLFPTGDDLGDGYFGIAAGPDGNLWSTDASRGRIARITPQGQIRPFPAAAVMTAVAPRGHRAVHVRVRCPAASALTCRGTLHLESSMRRGAARPFLLAPGTSTEVALPLTAIWRARLAADGRLRLLVGLTPELAPHQAFPPGSWRAVALRR